LGGAPLFVAYQELHAYHNLVPYQWPVPAGYELALADIHKLLSFSLFRHSYVWSYHFVLSKREYILKILAAFTQRSGVALFAKDLSQ